MVGYWFLTQMLDHRNQTEFGVSCAAAIDIGSDINADATCKGAECGVVDQVVDVTIDV